MSVVVGYDDHDLARVWGGRHLATTLLAMLGLMVPGLANSTDRRGRPVQNLLVGPHPPAIYDRARMSRPPGRARLIAVDESAVVADYEANVTVAAICATHHVALTRLYEILDRHEVPRRQPNALKLPAGCSRFQQHHPP